MHAKGTGIKALTAKMGISRRTYYYRRSRGWTHEEALIPYDHRHDSPGPVSRVRSPTPEATAEVSRLLRAWR